MGTITPCKVNMINHISICNKSITFYQSDDDSFEELNSRQQSEMEKQSIDKSILKNYESSYNREINTSNKEKYNVSQYSKKTQEKNENQIKGSDSSKKLCEGGRKNCSENNVFLGKKIKSNHKKEDAEYKEDSKKQKLFKTVKIEKDEKIEKIEKDEKIENIDEIIDECKKTTIQILKSTDKESDIVFNNVKRLIFIAFVNMSIRNYKGDEKPEISVLGTNIESLLENYVGDKENKDIFNQYIAKIVKKNNDTMNLLGMKLGSYFEEIFKSNLKNENDIKKLRIGEGMIKSILSTIKCLIIQQRKKEKDVIKLDNINIDNIKKDNINQKDLIISQKNEDDNPEDILNNYSNTINENKSNNNNDNFININNKSTNSDTNEIHNKNNNNKKEEDKDKFRVDNLFNILKNMIVNAFKVILEKMTNQDINISEYKYESKNNHEKDKKFMETNFNEIVNKEEFQNFKEAVELIEITKKQFLENIMKYDKYKNYYYSKDAFFKYYEEKERKFFENLKIKKKAIEIFKSKDLEGLILLTKLRTTDKSYIKIKNNVVYNEEKGYDFSNKLSVDDENYIQRKMKKLREIADNPDKEYFKKD